MRHKIQAAIIAFGVLGALAGSASAQPYPNDDPFDQGGYDQGYGPYQGYGPGYAQAPQPYPYYDPNAGAYPGYGPPAYGPYDDAYGYGDYAYCDPYWGCPDDYYDLPVFDGSVFYDGGWYNGPFFWRDYDGRREFWIHGGWHGGNYRGGHFGGALGRDYFARRGLGGFARGGGRQNFARVAPQGGYQGGYRQPGFNGFRGGFAGRSNFNAQPQRSFGGGWQGHFQQQAQSFRGGGGGWHGGGGGWSHGGGGGWHGGGGGGWHGGGGGWHGGGGGGWHGGGGGGHGGGGGGWHGGGGGDHHH